MSHFKVLSGATLLLVLLIAGVVLFTNSVTAMPVKPPPPSPPPVQRPFQQTYVSGNPAIQANASSPHAPGYAFSKSDVAAFLNKYGFYSGPLVQGAHLKILTIQFVNAKRASQLMYGESVGRPDDYLVYYVKVEGPFLLTYMHGGPDLPGIKHPTPTTAKYGDAVFDGHTGNLLVWGVYFQ
jgi:hypothetical protein